MLMSSSYEIQLVGHILMISSSEKVPNEKNIPVNFEYVISETKSLLIIHIIKKFATF